MTLFCSSQELGSLFSDISGKAERARLQAKGGSMYPFIQSGDWVTIALCGKDDSDFRKGEVVLFKKDGNLYMHRVICSSEDCVIVKGDMSLGHDGVINADDIIARVVTVERNGRIIDLSSKSNRFIATVIADTSLLLQYPLVFFRKIFSLTLLFFLQIQRLKIYRDFLKIIITDKISIREAIPEDAEDIRDLFTMDGHDTKKDIVDIKKEGFWLVAERNKKIAAALTITRFQKNPDLWLIFGLEVKSYLRGLGIGMGIVQKAMIRARENGAEEIGLFVNKRSRPALGLYYKLGFKEEKNFPPEFNCFSDELYLVYRFNN